MLMWNSQKMVFQRTCVIFFGHSISKPPFHVLGSPSFYELYGGHYLPLSGKTENASYLFLFPYSPFGSLAAGVQVHNLDSKDNCPRVTGNAHHQGCVTGRGSSYRKIAFPRAAVILHQREHPVFLPACWYSAVMVVVFFLHLFWQCDLGSLCVCVPQI